MSGRLLRWCFRKALLLATLVAGTAALAVTLVVALVALPGTIDWGDLKPKLGATLTAATGRAVSVHGPLTVEFLPWPAFTLGDVRIANAPGAASRSMLEVRRLGIRLSLKALVRGRIEINRLVLDEPQLAIEPGGDGSPNWWLPVLRSGADEGSTLFPVSLDRVEVRGGRLLHAIGLVDQPLEAHDVDFVVTLPPGQGQVSVAGTGIVNGLPTRSAIEIRTGAVSGPPLTVRTDLPGGRLTFEGWTGQRSSTDPMHGHVTLETAAPATLAASLAQMMGRPPLRLDDALLHRIEASGDISLDDQHMSIKGLALAVDGVKIDGDLEISAGDGITVNGRLSVPNLDADQWIERLRAHPLLAPPPPAAQGSAARSVPTPRFDLVVQVAEARYRRGSIRDVVVAFKFDDEGFHVREAIAVLPGDCHLYYRIDRGGQVLPNRPDMVEIEAHRLRDTLKWMGIDTTSIPADRLQRLRLQGRTQVLESAVLVTDATFALDDQSGTGTARVALALPTTFSARIDLPRFDLDSYRLTGQALDRMIPAPGNSPSAAADTMPPPVIDISLKIDEVMYRRQPVHDVDAQVVIQGNRLTLERVGVGNLLGSRLEISGSVDDFATSPRLDLAWRGELADVDRVLDYAGLPRFARGRIGAGQTAGRAVGTLGAVRLPDFSVDMLGARIAAVGELSFGEDLRFDFPRWSLETPDIGTIVAVASGTAHRQFGALRASGSFRGDGRHAEFEGDLVIDGMSLSGRLSSTLDRHPTVAVALQARQTIRLDRWLPTAPLTGAAQAFHGWTSRADADGEPAWPSILKTLDGTLSLSAPGIAWGPYEMTGFALSAHLREGLLTVERFAGSLGGATARLSGTIDARQVPVALSIEGDLRDVDISRTIAVAHTANDFGTDDLAVALHGKISFEDVVLRASGATLEAALPSLSGKGRATGDIRPVVTRGSLSLATLATGIGSLFSTEMGFASAVIENFVGRWVSSRGALEVGDGVVHLREYLLQGDRVTAVIRGQVDALHEAVDTRIDLNGKDGTLDYSMSLHGPLRAPTLEKETSNRQ